MQYLRADTNTEVLIGPVVAVGDGFTPVTTLSPSTADEAELIKYGGASALTVTDISGSTMAAITGADGYYTLDISTGNTDTEGFLTVLFNDDSLCLPVRHDFMVVNANVYDSLFAAATTDYLQVDMLQIAGNTTNATNVGTAGSNYSATRGLAGTALPAAAADGVGGLPISDAGGLDMDAILADTNELQTDWANGGRLDNILDAKALEATVAALNNLSVADINAQVSDVLKTDTVSEMAQGAPPAAPTMQQILNYLYRELVRNKVVVDTNTANQKQIFADDGSTILYEKDLTNATNITTVAEATTGA